jgi:soluble lytic murein transglycosylase-like protein
MRALRQPAVLLAAATLGAVFGVASAAAQTPAAPRVSTTLSDTAPSGAQPAAGRISVDFGAPAEGPKPDPAPAAPAAPAPAREEVDHHAPGHVCSTGDPSVDHIVRDESARNGIDACFVVAVMRQESGCSRWAVSPKGACGYMQLMPDTARRFGAADLFDPRQNIGAGTRYLRFLLDRFNGSMELALAGYNAGEGAVERYGFRIPPFAETQNYVRLITGRYLSVHAAKTSDLPAPAPKAPEKPAVNARISVEFEDK